MLIAARNPSGGEHSPPPGGGGAPVSVSSAPSNLEFTPGHSAENPVSFHIMLLPCGLEGRSY